MSVTVKAVVLVVWAFFLASYVRQVSMTTQYHQIQTHAVQSFAALEDGASSLLGH